MPILKKTLFQKLEKMKSKQLEKGESNNEFEKTVLQELRELIEKNKLKELEEKKLGGELEKSISSKDFSTIEIIIDQAVKKNISIDCLGLPYHFFSVDNKNLLQLAAEKGWHSIVKRLLKNGANLRLTTTIYRYTPLHLAASNGHLPVVIELINYGADSEVLDGNMKTPLMLAKSTEVKEFLRTVKDKKSELRRCATVEAAWGLHDKDENYLAWLPSELINATNELVFGSNVLYSYQQARNPLRSVFDEASQEIENDREEQLSKKAEL